MQVYLPITDDMFFNGLFSLLGGMTGISLAAFALFGVKALVLAFQWKLGQMVGIWKLTVISALTVVATVLAGLAAGVPLRGALCNSAVFTAFSVFLNNVYKQWQNRHSDKAMIQAGQLLQPEKK